MRGSHALLCVVALCAVIIASMTGVRYGERVGAKIAMQGGYRLEEVQGSCDTDHLFAKDECPRCH
jgi:hypothetical protein